MFAKGLKMSGAKAQKVQSEAASGISPMNGAGEGIEVCQECPR